MSPLLGLLLAMNIKYKVRSFSVKALSEAEISSMRDIQVKKFVVQQSQIGAFIGGAAEKALMAFPWIPKDMVRKAQSFVPFIMSWLSPGETIRLYVQLDMELAGIPISSRSVFVVQVTA